MSIERPSHEKGPERKYPEGLTEAEREAYDVARDAVNHNEELYWEAHRLWREIETQKQSGRGRGDIQELWNKYNQIGKEAYRDSFAKELPALRDMWEVTHEWRGDRRVFGERTLDSAEISPMQMITNDAFFYSRDRKALVMRNLWAEALRLRNDRANVVDVYVHQRYGEEEYVRYKYTKKVRGKGEELLELEALSDSTRRIQEITGSLIPSAQERGDDASVKAHQELLTRLEKEEAMLSGKAERDLSDTYRELLTEEQIQLATTHPLR